MLCMVRQQERSTPPTFCQASWTASGVFLGCRVAAAIAVGAGPCLLPGQLARRQVGMPVWCVQGGRRLPRCSMH